MMNANITLNNEKNGIEIRFDGKPEESVIAALKENGFRWSGKQKMWYAKQTVEAIAFAKTLNSGNILSVIVKNKTEKHDNYNLWKMTRTDGICDNYTETKLTNVTEIAAIVRKHIKPRFPMCKFSVKSDYNSIDIELLASPFAKDSEEVKAIVHYVYTFANSYNYDNSDLMSDYHDVNFYIGSERGIISYRYEQNEMTEEIQSMVIEFANKKEEFEAAEKVRKQKEHEEYLVKRAEEERIYQEHEKQKKFNHEAIENGVEVVNLENGYFLNELLSPRCNKMNAIPDIESQIREGSYSTVVCRVTREVYMTTEIYDLFKNMLISSFSFLVSMGGDRTDDNRISTMTDYEHMDKEERKTVQWYCNDCIAIFCDNKLVMVCDPQGHDYARYSFIPSEKTERADEYVTAQIITSEQLEEYRAIAESLEDRSYDIITQNGWIGTWNKQHFNEYRREMVKGIKENNIQFDANVVRAIFDDGAFKDAMYRILETTAPIREQFADSVISEGDMITIIKMDSFLGGVHHTHCVFQRCENSDWGGKDGVKIIVKEPHKRGEQYHILNGECIIVKGWIDIPRSLFWEDVPSTGVLKCEKTKFSSFDKKQFDVTIEYLCSIGAEIIINTYKPMF